MSSTSRVRAEEYLDFRALLLLLAQEDEASERVVQINFQLFPLTRTGGKDDD